MFDPVGPIGEQFFRLYALTVEALAIAGHRDGRLDHRDGIAMRDYDRGVGEDLFQHWELLEMLRAFERPALRTPDPLKHFEHRLHVLVMRRLVRCVVVVPPFRDDRYPL